MRRVCVFCGSSSGDRADYAAAATSLGAAIAERGLGLVYGGGNVGLMGLLADAALAFEAPLDALVGELGELAQGAVARQRQGQDRRAVAVELGYDRRLGIRR